ncbi:MAG: hypothetical protein IJL28_08565 [Prevotella sp.]|nr:hypothetical protein [Prevotella sp.]
MTSKDRYTVNELSLFGEAEMGGFSLEEIILAYRKCLRGKLGTHEAQLFQMNYMEECVRLWRDLNAGLYQVSRYISFASFRPVLREIFGSAFRDRVVDTLLAEKLVPVLEQLFVIDNYSTREGKGCLFAVQRTVEMIRQCSENYTRDCYLLKDDISSFFMAMSKDIAMKLWSNVVNNYYQGNDRALVEDTLRRIIYDRPEKHCIFKGSPHDLDGIPPEKLLRNSDGRHGFPIGKMISQLTALIYLNELDHLIAEQWGFPLNGHYMDDRVTVGHTKAELMAVKQKIDSWHLQHDLHTHPRKTYLQHYTKGVLFAGAFILPGRSYVSKRSVGNAFHRLAVFNYRAANDRHYVRRHAEEFAQTMNSYLGLLMHHTEWNTTHRLIREIGPEWYEVMMVDTKGKGHYRVVLLKPFRPRVQAVTKLKKKINSYAKH